MCPPRVPRGHMAGSAPSWSTMPLHVNRFEKYASAEPRTFATFQRHTEVPSWTGNISGLTGFLPDQFWPPAEETRHSHADHLDQVSDAPGERAGHCAPPLH